MSDRPDDPYKTSSKAAGSARSDRGADAAEDPYGDEYDDDLRDELRGAKSERGFTTKVIGDLAKRALMTGIGAVFMSEESLKSQLSDMKLPKEAMAYVVGQADKTKKEIVTAIARETREFLSKLEMDKVLARVLAGTTIEIQTRIKILPKEGGGLTTEVQQQQTSLVREPAADSASKDSGSNGEDADERDDKGRRKKSKKRDDPEL